MLQEQMFPVSEVTLIMLSDHVLATLFKMELELPLTLGVSTSMERNVCNQLGSPDSSVTIKLIP